MGNATFNQGKDYFALGDATSGALKVKSSSENRSKSSASGANCYGDAAVVDSWGETVAPSAEYDVVDTVEHTIASPVVELGSVIAAADSGVKVGGTAVPVVFGSLAIRTQNGAAPSVTANGQAVQTGATTVRTYCLPAFTLSPRHRAQDFLSLCTIKKGSGTLTVADPATDYGLDTVSANFPIAFNLAQPKGETCNYDIHGDMVTVDYAMNWYATGEPTIVLASTVTLRTSSAATSNTSTVAPTMSTPVSEECPEGGYVRYTWQVSFPLIGYEAS
ncbi:MAG: hypothetical protein K6G94_09675 [Kiritimatiellae bacterium]|nr:hypothetical protein [Kiritimatiellia bacterium]